MRYETLTFLPDFSDENAVPSNFGIVDVEPCRDAAGVFFPFIEEAALEVWDCDFIVGIAGAVSSTSQLHYQDQ